MIWLVPDSHVYTTADSSLEEIIEFSFVVRRVLRRCCIWSTGSITHLMLDMEVDFKWNIVMCPGNSLLTSEARRLLCPWIRGEAGIQANSYA